jgi:hypothetical protein
MVVLLFLDGHLGPASLALRRAPAVIALAVIGAATVRSLPRWRVAAAAVAVAALALLARAPSVPPALAALVIGLAAVKLAAGWRPGAAPVASGLFAFCLSYVALRFATDLVPQEWAMPAAAGGLGDLNVGAARGVDANLSFAALGAPPVCLAVLYLVWGWRQAGGRPRLVAAAAIPLGWFALLPLRRPMPRPGRSPPSGVRRGRAGLGRQPRLVLRAPRIGKGRAHSHRRPLLRNLGTDGAATRHRVVR